MEVRRRYKIRKLNKSSTVQLYFAVEQQKKMRANLLRNRNVHTYVSRNNKGREVMEVNKMHLGN